VVDEAQERIAAADGIGRRGQILALLTRLKQVCNHPAHFLADGSALAGRSGKFERLVEMLEEARDEGDRALVFTQYREMGTLLERGLRERLDREVLFLHGGTPRRQREQMVARFQAPKDGPPLFVLSLKAGGTGLNLTRANHVFHFDRWWNPAVEDQATDRAHRIGQTQRVQVHKLVCAGTLEERIGAMIRRKKAVAEQVVGSGEAWLTELSTEQLRELVALGDDAVSE
jgi:SNF2 family DNA or RNA helicase